MGALDVPLPGKPLVLLSYSGPARGTSLRSYGWASQGQICPCGLRAVAVRGRTNRREFNFKTAEKTRLYCLAAHYARAVSLVLTPFPWKGRREDRVPAGPRGPLCESV